MSNVPYVRDGKGRLVPNQAYKPSVPNSPLAPTPFDPNNIGTLTLITPSTGSSGGGSSSGGSSGSSSSGSSGGGSSPPTALPPLSEAQLNQAIQNNTLNLQPIPPKPNKQLNIPNSSGLINRIQNPNVSIDYAARDKQNRIEQLKQAGFNPIDIAYLTSSVGGKQVFYNGKVVPESPQAKQFYQTANLERIATEKRFSDTAVAGGLVGLGLGPIVAGAGLGAVAGGIYLAGSQGSTIGSAIGNPFTNQKPESSILTQEAAAKQGFNEQSVKASMNLTDNVISNVLPGSQILDKDSFVRGAAQYLTIEKGYNQADAFKEATAIYHQYAAGGAAGTIIGMIGVSAATNMIGGILTNAVLKNTVITPVIKFFSKEGQKLATKSAIAIGGAGAVEGFGFYDLERKAKLQEFDTGKAIYYTAGGTVSAAGIGGGLFASSITNPGASKLGQKVFYSIDWLEKPGDTTDAAVRLLMGNNFSPAIKPVTIVPSFTTTNSNPIVNTNPNTNPLINPSPNTSPFVNTSPLVNPNPSVNTSPLVNPNPSVNTSPLVNPNPKSNPMTNTNPTPNPIVNTDPIVDTDPIVNTNPNTNTNPTTNPIVNTNPNTNTNTNTDVITGFPPGIPPIGFGLGDASGGRGSKYKVKNTTKFKSLFFTSQKPIMNTKSKFVQPKNNIFKMPGTKISKPSVQSIKNKLGSSFYSIGSTKLNRKETSVMNKDLFRRITRDVAKPKSFMNTKQISFAPKQNFFSSKPNVLRHNSSILMHKPKSFSNPINNSKSFFNKFASKKNTRLI